MYNVYSSVKHCIEVNKKSWPKLRHNSNQKTLKPVLNTTKEYVRSMTIFIIVNLHDRIVTHYHAQLKFPDKGHSIKRN